MATRKMRIMAAGPVEVPDEVRAAGSLQVPHHRTKGFRAALKDSLEGLKRLFSTSGQVLMFASSGTGAMESCVANLFSPGDKVLVTICGNFSERWAEICEAFGLKVKRLEFPWGGQVDPGKLAAELRDFPACRGVFTVFNETSTGVTNDIEAIGKAVGAGKALLVVDGISGVGALPYRMDEWGVDATVVGSQKGLMLAPGLSFVGLGKRARDRVAGSKLPKFYFSFAKAIKSLEAEEIPDTPFTPAVSLVIQLREALRLMEREGYESIWRRNASLGEATRAAVKALGMRLFASAGHSNVVTAVDCALGPNASEIVKRMRDDYGVSLIGGQGKLKGKIFRIGHVGNVDELDVLACIGALEMALKGLDFPVKLGAGVAAAQGSFLASRAGPRGG